MNFLVDAHLPAGLCNLLRRSAHDVVHTNTLAAGNRTPDPEIAEFSLRDRRVVVTKDTDFYHSHLVGGKPWKLLLVRTGNIRTRDLVALFERHLPDILAALEDHSLVELDRRALRVVV